MEISKPVFAITDDVTDLKDIIEKSDCGWWISGDKIDEVVCKIKEICENRAIYGQLGKNGRIYFEHNYDVENNVIILEKFIKKED